MGIKYDLTGNDVYADSFVGGIVAANGVKFLSGAGAPTGLTAPKGSLYTNTSASTTATRLYVNTDGGTTWANFTASA